MTMNTPALGLDLAEETFLAALWLDDQRCLTESFDNRPQGFLKLWRWVKRHGFGPLRAGLESTNTCGQKLAQFLYERACPVFILNPEVVAKYAVCQGRRNKTDPADARVIAAYVAKHELTPWSPPPPEQLDLRALTRTRQQLVEQYQALCAQRRTAAPIAQPFLDTVLSSFKQQLKQIEQAIARHLTRYPVLGDKVRRLTTLKGVGLTTAAVVIAELPTVTAQSDPRALCAWTGLTPCRKQSGKTQWRTHLSRRGNAYLRNALFMPALVAKRYNPLFCSFAQRLLQNGKSKTAVLGAIAHKLLRTLIGMLKHNTDFHPSWTSS